MSNRWERDGTVAQLAGEMDELALSIRVGAWEPTYPQAFNLMRAAVALASEASSYVPGPSIDGDPVAP